MSKRKGYACLLTQSDREIYAWVTMTNHVHLVFRSMEGIPPGQLLGSFKRHTSKAVVKAIDQNQSESRREVLLDALKRNGTQNSNVKQNQFRRQNSKPIELWSRKVISQKIKYIHNNPVEQGYVFSPEDISIEMQLIIAEKKELWMELWLLD